MVTLCFFSTSRQTSSVIWVVAMAGLIGCRDEVAKRPVRGDKRERKALRQEARGISLKAGQRHERSATAAAT